MRLYFYFLFEETAEKEILWATENGNKELVRNLITTDPLLVHSRDSDGYTPLHRACYNNDLELVDLFLSNGANINAKTEYNWEPLHSACQWNHFECAARLIQYGADVNAKSNGGDFLIL